VFGKRVLRRILALEGEGMTGGWRNLCDKEVHYMYCCYSEIKQLVTVMG